MYVSIWTAEMRRLKVRVAKRVESCRRHPSSPAFLEAMRHKSLTQEPIMPRPKASEPNKSQSIRDHLAQNPKAKAKEVVAALGGKGVKVTEGLVYAVKGSMKERKRRKNRVVRAAKAATEGGHGVSIKADALTMIREVKALAAKAGGYGKLKELVDPLAG